MTRPVVVELRADGRGVIAAFSTTREEAERLKRQLDGTTQSTQRLDRSQQSATGTMRNFRAAAAASAAVLGARAYAAAADEMAQLNARLRLATDNQEQFAAAQQAVNSIALENGQALTAVGELYTRLAQSSAELRNNQAELDLITQAVTQSMRVSGASATESEGAIRQLSQAFAAGVLRGDEFNSVNEQAPRIMQALADSLGVTRGELRDLAEQGELTADVLRTALVDQASEIAAESAQIPATISESFTNLISSIQLVIGAFDGASGASSSFADTINGIATSVAGAADFISDQALNIRLAGIAMVRGLLLAFEELRGGFLLLQNVTTEYFGAIGNGFRTIVATGADAIARLIEINAAAADLIPGFNGVAESQFEVAAGLRETASEARSGIVELRSLSDVWTDTRQEVNQAKAQIRDITDDMADQAIEARNAAESVDGLANSQGNLSSATEETIELTQEQIDSIRAFDDAIADLEAQLSGPYAQAQRQFQRDAAEVAELFRTNFITGTQAAQMLELLQQRFNQTSAELAAGFYQQMQDLAFSVLPEAIQQMLGLVDATEQLQQRSSRFSLAETIAEGLDFLPERLAEAIGSGIEFGLARGVASISAQDLLDGNFAEIGRNLGQTVAIEAGRAFGSFIGGPIGGEIGALVGDLIGDLLLGESVPKFQVRGTNATRAIDEGTDFTIDTALATTEFAFRRIEAEAQQQVRRAFVEFDEAIASFIRDETQLSAIETALDRFGVSSRSDGEDLENLLSLRFDAILSTFDATTRALVNQAGSLEEQVQRLADIEGIRQATENLEGLGLDFQGTLQVLAELEQPGEGLASTFTRLQVGMDGFETVLSTFGITLEGSREDLARYVDGLTDAAGGIQNLTSTFNQVVNGLLDQRSLLEQRIGRAQSEAGGLLSSIGLDAGLASDPDAFRQQFAQLLPTLDPADAAVLLQAAATLTEVISLEEQLNQMRQQALEPVRDLARLMAETEANLQLAELNEFQSEIVSIRLEGLEAADALRVAAAAADFQGDAEQALGQIHENTARRVQAAIDRLTSAGRDIAERLFGTELDSVNDQIRILQEELGSAGDVFGNVADQAAIARQQLMVFADSLLIGNLSPLNQGRQLDVALDQLRSASASGDAAAVQQLAQQVLSIARDRFAGGAEFSDIFDQVQRIVRGTAPSSQQPQPVQIVSSPALEALFAERDELEAEQQRQQDVLLGRQLAQIVADLAGEGTRTFAQVADTLGFDLNQLADVLGFDTVGLETFIAGLQTDTVSVADSIFSLEQVLFDELKEQTDIWRDIQQDGLPIIFNPGDGTAPPDLPIAPPGGGPVDPDPGQLPPEEDFYQIPRQLIATSEGTTAAVETGSNSIVQAILATDNSAEMIEELRRIADGLEGLDSRGTTPVAT